MAMSSLAIVASRGTSNNIFQVATLVRAATALELAVQVLFTGDALLKLRRERVNLPEWSAVYAPVRARLEARLRAADFVDLETFLRDAKEHGDHVTFWAESESLRSSHATLDALVPLLDGQLERAQFRALAAKSDALLTF